MQILLLDATGRVGSHILAEALSNGHSVTTLVRNSLALTSQTGLTIVDSTPLKESDIIHIIESSQAPIDVVITALNNPRKTGCPFRMPVGPSELIEASHRNLLPAMRKHGIKRLVVLSAFGVGASNPNVFFPLRYVLNKSNVSICYPDHERTEELLKIEASTMEWTIVKPSMLTGG